MAAKLKDGLFLGDYEAAYDLEFLTANKISRIVNCAGREVPNQWQRAGVRYLSFQWPESGNCIIFDEANTVLDEIYSFIEDGIEGGQSILVHSVDGYSRACFCCCVFFMLKYRWTFSKTMEFLRSKRPDLQPRPGFARQLSALDSSLYQLTMKAMGAKAGKPAARGLPPSMSPRSSKLMRRFVTWDPIAVEESMAAKSSPVPVTSDELLLTNTFLNSKSALADGLGGGILASRLMGGGVSKAGSRRASRKGDEDAARRVQWIDNPRRQGTTHKDVPVSPMTRRQTVERPPTPSYNALKPADGWLDRLEGSQAGRGRGAGASNAQRRARLAAASRPKSAGGAISPARHRRISPEEIGGILCRRQADGSLGRPRSAPLGGRKPLTRTARSGSAESAADSVEEVGPAGGGKDSRGSQSLAMPSSSSGTASSRSSRDSSGAGAGAGTAATATDANRGALSSSSQGPAAAAALGGRGRTAMLGPPSDPGPADKQRFGNGTSGGSRMRRSSNSSSSSSSSQAAAEEKQGSFRTRRPAPVRAGDADVQVQASPMVSIGASPAGGGLGAAAGGRHASSDGTLPSATASNSNGTSLIGRRQPTPGAGVRFSSSTAWSADAAAALSADGGLRASASTGQLHDRSSGAGGRTPGGQGYRSARQGDPSVSDSGLAIDASRTKYQLADSLRLRRGAQAQGGRRGPTPPRGRGRPQTPAAGTQQSAASQQAYAYKDEGQRQSRRHYQQQQQQPTWGRSGLRQGSSASGMQSSGRASRGPVRPSVTTFDAADALGMGPRDHAGLGSMDRRPASAPRQQQLHHHHQYQHPALQGSGYSAAALAASLGRPQSAGPGPGGREGVGAGSLSQSYGAGDPRMGGSGAGWGAGNGSGGVGRSSRRPSSGTRGREASRGQGRRARSASASRASEQYYAQAQQSAGSGAGHRVSGSYGGWSIGSAPGLAGQGHPSHSSHRGSGSRSGSSGRSASAGRGAHDPRRSSLRQARQGIGMRPQSGGQRQGQGQGGGGNRTSQRGHDGSRGGRVPQGTHGSGGPGRGLSSSFSGGGGPGGSGRHSHGSYGRSAAGSGAGTHRHGGMGAGAGSFSASFGGAGGGPGVGGVSRTGYGSDRSGNRHGSRSSSQQPRTRGSAGTGASSKGVGLEGAYMAGQSAARQGYGGYAGAASGHQQAAQYSSGFGLAGRGYGRAAAGYRPSSGSRRRPASGGRMSRSMVSSMGGNGGFGTRDSSAWAF